MPSTDFADQDLGVLDLVDQSPISPWNQIDPNSIRYENDVEL